MLLFVIPVVLEKTNLKLALAISTGAPIAVANKATEIPPLVADKKN